MQDKTLVCMDCGTEFIFSAKDQKFYAEQNPPYKDPKRCFNCRQIRKNNDASNGVERHVPADKYASPRREKRRSYDNFQGMDNESGY